MGARKSITASLLMLQFGQVISNSLSFHVVHSFRFILHVFSTVIVRNLGKKIATLIRLSLSPPSVCPSSPLVMVTEESTQCKVEDRAFEKKVDWKVVNEKDRHRINSTHSFSLLIVLQNWSGQRKLALGSKI